LLSLIACSFNINRKETTTVVIKCLNRSKKNKINTINVQGLERRIIISVFILIENNSASLHDHAYNVCETIVLENVLGWVSFGLHASYFITARTRVSSRFSVISGKNTGIFFHTFYYEVRVPTYIY